MSRRTRLTCALSALLVAVLALVVWQVPQVASAQNESGSSPQDVVWSFDPAKSPDLPDLENTAGTWSGISIDATSGKFSPRSSDGDTQINAGTKLSFEVSESVAGATIEIIRSGGTVSVSATVDDEAVSVNTTPGNNVALSVGEQGGSVVLTFGNQAYLKAMTLTYGEAPEEFPGTPADVEVKDAVWSFVGSDEPEIQGTTAVWDTLKIDATSGKFDLRGTDAQVNAGTSIYVPVAQSDDGASLIVAGSANNQQVYVDDAAIELGRPVSVDTTSGPRYVKLIVEGDGSAYLTSISIDYAADTSTYPGTPEGVSAADMTWDLTQGGEQVQGARGEFHGILVDATVGKFAPRNDVSGSDTQVNPGTTLYVPVAVDAKGAVLRIEGSNSGGLSIEVDGEPAQLGTDIALVTEETRYVPISFAGNDGASCYLTSISVDYASDSVESTHVVTVGPGGDYATITEALADNDSSLKDRLVISIAPGSYHERVVIDKPGVTLQNADETGENPVVIHESYFSGNVWNSSGEYVPQDPIYDLGTDQCATVLVEATATGFSARGITFQNDYNVVDNLGEDEQTPAVAFNSKADKVELVDCRFIGRQDTLYVQGAGNRVFLSGCYVEGTVDFVFGDADAYFHGCTLHMVAFPGRTSGYYTAANTKSGYTGLVFVKCTLTADASLDDVSLGRPWQNLCHYDMTTRDAEGHTIYHGIDTTKPHAQYANVSSAVSFVGCTMPANLNETRWDRWTGRDESGNTVSVTYDGTVRFAEYGSRNADGTLASPSTGESMDFLTFDRDADLKATAAGLRGQMKIGGAYWTPSHLGFVEDDDFWTEEGPVAPIDPNDPVDPEKPEEPVDPEKPEEPVGPERPEGSVDAERPANAADTAGQDGETEGLAATGDATSTALVAPFLGGAAVLLVGSSVARRRLG